MDIERSTIRASCRLYACRECRTKTGWPHQRWCALVNDPEPSCADCHYWSASKNACSHPSHKKDGDAD